MVHGVPMLPALLRLTTELEPLRLSQASRLLEAVTSMSDPVAELLAVALWPACMETILQALLVTWNRSGLPRS